VTDPPTGEQLYNELCEAAGRVRKSLAAFAAPLFNGASWKIEQMRIAAKPTDLTVRRVRVLIAGEALPEKGHVHPCHQRMTRAKAEAAGIPPSGRSQYEQHLLEQQRKSRTSLDWQMAISEHAKLSRRPGQSIADRVRELRLEHGG
jgi:hypothetical protein